MSTFVPFPDKFSMRMADTLGEREWQAFANEHQSPAPVSIRHNPLKKGGLATSTNVPWAEKAWYLENRPVFTLDPLFHAGVYYVQEPSSMLLEQVVKQKVSDMKVVALDLSAAPGGKSTHLISLLSPDSLLISNEVIRSRANILSENMQKWGYPNCIVTNNDPEHFSRLEGFFDIIVADVPCSGEGLFRKSPQAMSEWSEENAALCSARQQRILHDVWSSLKTGGLLIYSTCTYNPDENERNLSAFSKTANVLFEKLFLPPEWGIVEITSDNVIGYQCLPHRVRGEGFFISVLRKLDDTSKQKLTQKKLVAASRRDTEKIRPWLIEPDRYTTVQHDDLIFAFPRNGIGTLEAILANLRVVYAGTNLGRVKHEKIVPEHSLAVSIIVNADHFPAIDLNLTDALKYLRKDALQIESSTRGYALVRYQENNLGWANVLPNRLNNLYPNEWRIRMNLSTEI